ncbi:unnamed protein product [Lupinus luteus]|uniref:C3H1-type domain-containing protein n=1 Tax=Lupinus luteus TaxID=3873 RepID=A0AAV1X8L4_LUPLU
MDQHHSHHYLRTKYAPTFSHHHNPNHLPPPPQQPSHPHLSSYRTTASAPYRNNNYPPQFAPNYPIQQDRPISNNHHHPHSCPNSHSFSDNNDLPRRALLHFDQSSWNPNPRVTSENRHPRNYSQVDFDMELHHRLVDRLPPPPPLPPLYRPIDNLQFDHDDGSSRLRMEHMDLYESNPREREREESVWGRGGNGNHHPSDFEPKYDSPSQQVWKSDYYGNELGKYNSRGNIREGAHEFTRTSPEKQIQKKSALLRLQTVKPNRKNRENERLCYTGYAAEINSNFFRAEEREERKGSPVELDISFESNSLVAKAIVPPSSSAVVCDTNMTTVSYTDMCSTERRKKVSVSESDCSGLPPAKLPTGSVSLDSSPCKANGTFSSAKELSLQKNVSDTCSPPCTSLSDMSHGKKEATLSNVTTNLCSEISSPIAVQKKKLVKRAIKKVVKNRNSTLSHSPSANTHHGTVQTDSLTSKLPSSPASDKIETSMKEKSTTGDKVSTTDSLHSLPNEGNVFPEYRKKGLSLLSFGPHSRSHGCKTGEDSDIGKLARVYHLNSNDLTGSEVNHTDLQENPSGSVENFIVSESGNDGIAGKALRITQNTNLERNQDTDVPISEVIAISSSVNNGIQEGLNCIQHASVLKQGSANESANSEDSITTHCCDTGKLVSPSDATVFLENCDTEETLSNLNISVEFDTYKIKEREVQSHLNILSSKIEGISPDPVNPVSYASYVDRATNVLKMPSPSQDFDQSVKSLDLNSKSSADEVTTLHGKIEVSETEFCVENNGNDVANKVSRASKRKKVTATHPTFSNTVVVTTSCADNLTSFSDNQAQKKGGTLSSMSTLSIAQSIPYSKGIAKLPDNILVGCSFESINADRGLLSSEHSEIQHTDIASYSLCENMPILNLQFSMLQGEKKENIIPAVPISSTQTDTSVIGNSKRKKTGLEVVEESYQYRDLVQISPIADMESNDLNMKDDLLPQQNLMPCHTNGDGINASILDVELIEDVPDALSIMCSKGMASEVPAGKILNYIKSSQDYSKVKAHGLSSFGSELNRSKNQPGDVIPKTFQGHSFTFSKTKTSASSFHISKPRTWLRTINTSHTYLPGIKPLVATVPPKRSILERKGNTQNTSYIRKGNSLIRKPSLVSASSQISSAKQSPSFGLNELPKNTRSESQVDLTEPILKAGITIVPQQRQRTPPAPIDTNSDENMSAPLVEPPEDQTDPSNNGESEVEANGRNISSLKPKRIVYIKPKTNQLVATSNYCDVSVSTDNKTGTAFSDGYYKRNKNQLVRTTFESHINQTVAMPNSTVSSDGQGVRKVLSNKRFSKRRSHKVAGTSCKPLRASLEATLTVAAVERKKRGQESAACIGSRTKKAADCVGERIFRIGSVRYRMDPSRRTLKRISDDEPMSSASVPSGLTAKRAYIPRRLVIGNDEYIRIGNGNQLIRDPKKRTRKLANEKVRWSLHTARQRLTRKQKYCQFFTRFGKCNKDGGKCPYIHDPTKIAVCTKFLNGLCSTPNCTLTHKVLRNIGSKELNVVYCIY